jgi:HK97 family phage major capsid protein
LTKEMRALLQELESKKAQVRALLAEDKVTEAEQEMEEVRALQKKIELQKEVEAMEDFGGDGQPVDTGVDRDLNAEYKRVFLRGLRRQRLTADDQSIIAEYYRTRGIRAEVMHEGTDPANPAAGNVGLIVPQDIQTRINEIMRQLNDLSQYIRVETVNTLSGSRVLEADNVMTPLQVVNEYAQIQEMDNPQFVPIQYQLTKRAGYLPLTSELLADSDQNIINYVSNWIARKVVVTKNTLITGLLQGLQPVQLANFDDIKKVLNVDLDPAISLNSVIITNQDGYHWMDTQVDQMGRYLLQDDITQPGRKLFKGRPVVVVSNRYLSTIQGPPDLAPIFIGNGEQFAVLFTRGVYELASTTEGGDAWRRDTTELRVITRDDLQMWDAAAMVYGQLQM